MPDERPLKEAAREWLRFAGEDLDYAREGLRSIHLAPGVACFHAQQVAEKALKAVLVLAGSEVPRTHDLERLTELLPSERTSTLPVDVAELTPFAVIHRYPGEDEAPTREQLAKAVELATRVLDWAKVFVD